MTQRHEARKCCRENGVDRFAQLRVVTNLEFVKKWGEKKALSVEGNQAKHSKMRSADINLKDTKTHLSSRAREGKKKIPSFSDEPPAEKQDTIHSWTVYFAVLNS